MPADLLPQPRAVCKLQTCCWCAVQKSLRKGEYLWELISPKEKDGLPARSTTGRYRVKLFLLVSAANTAAAGGTLHGAEP